jgi:hypothetical protein
MIEWEWPSRSIGVYRDLLRRPSRHLISAMAQCSDVNGTSGKVHLHCAANFAVSSNFRDWLERLRSDWARLWGPVGLISASPAFVWRLNGVEAASLRPNRVWGTGGRLW